MRARRSRGVAWRNAVRLLTSSRRPVITTHVQPDGDAVGAEVALAEVARSLGSRPWVLNSQPVPSIYGFLARRNEPAVYQPERDDRRLKGADLAVIVDANSWKRTGPVGSAISALGLPSLCIDHHETLQPFTTVSISVPSASSTSELVYDLARHLKVSLSLRARMGIYTGLLFDTGSFRHDNTSLRCHQIAGELIASGLSAAGMYERVFENFTWGRIRLFERALGTLRAECGGRLAWLTITRDMFAETGTRSEEVEGFVDWLRSIGDAQLILIFREEPNGVVKGSFRSKSAAINVEELARRFGGGGHRRAAGATLDGSIEDAARSVVTAAKAILGRSSGKPRLSGR